MCGIVGILRWDRRPVSEQEISALNACMRHRGPDEEGVYVEGGVGMGMCRLAIIDIEGGHQPMRSADESLVIVFNGEIYNYRELQNDLKSRGWTFRTRSDTETVLVGYQCYGPSVLQHLNGMFAFAIHDRKSGRTFLARDRFGEKQIYYATGQSHLVFGSEMKVPMRYGEGLRQLNLTALPEYLNYQYVGGEETAVQGISLLPAGSFMEVTSTGVAQTSQYWSLPSALVDSTAVSSEDEAAEMAYMLLRESVKSRLVADVPVSVMLSSGLDSSALAYILGADLGVSLRCFSLGVLDKTYDESRDAGRLAAAYGFPWEQSVITGSDVADFFDDYLEHNDSLQANTGQLVYYALASRIHEAGYKVTLNGNGGDELFAGYPTYQADVAFRIYRKLPATLRRGLYGAARKLPPMMGRISFDYKIRKFCECTYTDDPLLAHGSWRTIFSREVLSELLSGESPDLADCTLALYRRAYEKLAGRNLSCFKKTVLADMDAWLTAMQPWEDNVTMAHSVEMRLPFLDHELARRVLSLPDGYLFRGWKLKRLMRRFLASRLPPKVVRRRKRGTHLPVGKWLNSELKPLCDHYLSARVLNRLGLFSMSTVQRLLAEHRTGKRDNAFSLWTLLVFSAWLEHNRIER